MTSKIKVDNITDQGGNNMVVKCGTTQTLGTTGVTVALASGASQTGFGRTGSVNWQTTKKTANFTASSGEGYFCDTAAVGSFTLTLPSSPNPGDIVGLKDYNGNFATANLIIGRNGSNLDGNAGDKTLDTDNLSLTIVYVDATQGWVPIEEGTGLIGGSFISATGGSVSTVCTNFKVHTFTGPGTFCISAGTGPVAVVDYLVIAGGGSGGWDGAGGGGAGGYRFSNGTSSGSYCAGPSPLGASGLPLSPGAFPITVGAGGAAITSSAAANNGSNSIFSTITSTGGGRGGRNPVPDYGAGPGGSGGGSKNDSTIGSGNTPPVTPPQGNNGGTGPGSGGGGGGAGAVGGAGVPAPGVGGTGGNGLTSCITASPVARGGGGAGGNDYPGSGVSGGTGGGGPGGVRPSTDAGGSGTANTGGGGGGAGVPGSGGSGAGGSGVVIIRYKFQ